MDKFERRQQFETFMRLKELAEPNRIIPADGWTPDTSLLDYDEPKINGIYTVVREDGLAEVRSNEATQAASDRWYGSRKYWEV